MAINIATLGITWAGQRGALLTWLGGTLDALLEHLGPGPEPILGDADSSLLAIARDLEWENRPLSPRDR